MTLALSMLADVAASLDIPSGTWCGEQQSSFGCSTDECKMPTNTSKETCDCDIGGNGNVGARFCYNGQFVVAWYSNTTSEEQCAANKANFATMLPSSFSYSSEGSLGECVASSYSAESSKMTCEGVPNFEFSIKKYFADQNCSEANFTRNETSWDFWRGQCMCMRRDSVTPRSECQTCGSTDVRCASEQVCSTASSDRELKCSFSGNCQCKSANYRTNGICRGGKQVTLYFKGATHTSCRSTGTTPYLETAYNGGEDSTSCKEGGEGKENATHRVEATCEGLADGSYPQKRLYNNSNSIGDMVEHSQSQVNRVTECECLRPSEKITSSCESCYSSDCNENQKSCTLAGSQSCSWMSSNSSCTCLSQNFKTEKACWSGSLVDLYFKSSSYSQCAAALEADLTLFKMSEQENECQGGGDGMNGATHKKRLDCTGVVNGGFPKTRYFSDSLCSVEIPEHAKTKIESSVCKCEKFMSCSKGTKFEKYYCDSNGGIIAQGFEDSRCLTPSGTNVSMTSFTDFSSNECSSWPPKLLDPTSTAMVRWSCKNNSGVFMPAYDHWESADTCSLPVQNQGFVEDCFCTNEFKFAALAQEVNSVVTGSLSMSVSDVATAISDSKFKAAVLESVAETAGMPSSYITALTLKAARRLGQSVDTGSRILSQGSIVAEYVIVVPKAMASEASLAMSSTTASSIQRRRYNDYHDCQRRCYNDCQLNSPRPGRNIECNCKRLHIFDSGWFPFVGTFTFSPFNLSAEPQVWRRQQ
ncbi:unnamed protein product [Polarella glacialis]|uniref:Uncharacterized protein n=1 Tax=Polarella glacialis TaxID=89957 RepID=A0A813DA07_POLGL|nr:unnamed protein product [Polarella glacialis]